MARLVAPRDPVDLGSIMLLPLRIRPATTEDCGFLWLWANDSVVRQNSFNMKTIGWLTHVHWFHKKLGEDAVYIVTDGAHDPIAVLRIDNEEVQPEISITISAPWRGRGLGAQVIELGSTITDKRPILARIKPTNAASIKAFSKAGYKLMCTTEDITYMHLTNSSK